MLQNPDDNSIHFVKDVEVIKKKSRTRDDLYYTDIVVTCTDGKKRSIELFSDSEITIRERAS